MAISQQHLEKIHDYLALWYKTQWTQAHTQSLLEEFDYLDGEQLLEACRRHIHDQTSTSQGQPAGTWPPKVADIEAQLTAMHVERSRATQEARLRELKQESDQTYRQAVLGQGVSREGRVRDWGMKIREQIRLAGVVRRRLEAHLGLDYRLQEDMKLLMDTLGAVDLANQTMEEIEEVARELAGKLGMDLEARMGRGEVPA